MVKKIKIQKTKAFNNAQLWLSAEPTGYLSTMTYKPE